MKKAKKRDKCVIKKKGKNKRKTASVSQKAILIKLSTQKDDNQ